MKVISRYLPKTFGLGDFIRGSFVLLHVAKTLGREFLIDFTQHPCGQFIGYPVESDAKIIELDITKGVHNSFVLAFDIVRRVDGDVAICTNIETDQQPIVPITDEYKRIIKAGFQPKPDFQNDIDTFINTLPRNYETFHIRMGDSHMVDKAIREDVDYDPGEAIDDEILEILNKLASRRFYPEYTVVISDCAAVEAFFKELGYYTVPGVAVHTAHQDDLAGIKHTLLSFFVMSRTRRIVNYSFKRPVVRGINDPFNNSGFSWWCSRVYDIPREYCNRLIISREEL
jgi:hypothetical protein